MEEAGEMGLEKARRSSCGPPQTGGRKINWVCFESPLASLQASISLTQHYLPETKAKGAIGALRMVWDKRRPP